MTYSIAYIVDQAFFSVAYLIVAVLFLLQLLVERKAKYDAKVLNARQRLDDWHADRGGNNRGSAMVSPRGSSSMPKSARRASAGPVSQDDDSTSVSRLEGSKGSVTDQTSHNGSHEKKQRRLRVGLLQWSFHRLGLIMALIMCWREVDPYGVHGLFSFVHVQFLSLNAQALLYICALIAFFYPIHLVRVVAFHARTRVLEVLGGSLSILTLAIANITPGLYSRYGVVNGIRALTSIWFGITLLIACIVFNIYMFRLVISIRKLTDEDGWKQEANTEMAPPEKKQNSTYQAEHSTSKRAASPLMPILDFNANGTAGGLTIAPSTTASRTPSRKNSLTGYNTGGSQVNLLRSASPTADLLPPVGDQTTDDEYGGSHLITPARLPSSNDETLDSSDQSNKPSPRGPNAFPTLSPHAHPSLSAPTTPSHSQRNLTAVNQQHLGTSSVVVEVNEHPTSASTPASPTFAAQTAAPNPPGSALNSARVVASAKADIRKKPSSPYARQYNEMLRKMQKFQVLATIIVVIVCIAITYSGMQQAAKFHEEFDVPKADDYMSAILIALFVLIVLVGEVIIFWYAYMPISILWTDVLRKPRAREAASPVANANGNSASAISAV